MGIVILYRDKWMVNMENKIEEISNLVDETDLKMLKVKDILKTLYYSVQYCMENELPMYNILVVCEILDEKLEKIYDIIDTLDLNIIRIKQSET